MSPIDITGMAPMSELVTKHPVNPLMSSMWRTLCSTENESTTYDLITPGSIPHSTGGVTIESLSVKNMLVVAPSHISPRLFRNRGSSYPDLMALRFSIMLSPY